MTTIGMMTITGLPADIHIDAVARRQMLRLFDVPQCMLEGLAGNTRDPLRPLGWFGWFPSQGQRLSWYEAFSIGADVVRGSAAVHEDDPFTGATPMPPEARRCDCISWRWSALARLCCGASPVGSDYLSTSSRSALLAARAECVYCDTNLARLARRPARTARACSSFMTISSA
jgi:hypothetical protein